LPSWVMPPGRMSRMMDALNAWGWIVIQDKRSFSVRIIIIQPATDRAPMKAYPTPLIAFLIIAALCLCAAGESARDDEADSLAAAPR
jgi:hypothetical protein